MRKRCTSGGSLPNLGLKVTIAAIVPPVLVLGELHLPLLPLPCEEVFSTFLPKKKKKISIKR